MKLERHSKIAELIGKKETKTQEELTEELRKAGFRVTQATVSCDIREMWPIKAVVDNGKQHYTVMQDEDPKIEKYVRTLRDSYQGMDRAQNLLVVKTVSGMAMTVAASLDAMHLREAVGCAAGDDTVFYATRSVDDTPLLTEWTRRMLLNWGGSCCWDCG